MANDEKVTELETERVWQLAMALLSSGTLDPPTLELAMQKATLQLWRWNQALEKDRIVNQGRIDLRFSRGEHGLGRILVVEKPAAPPKG